MCTSQSESGYHGSIPGMGQFIFSSPKPSTRSLGATEARIQWAAGDL